MAKPAKAEDFLAKMNLAGVEMAAPAVPAAMEAETVQPSPPKPARTRTDKPAKTPTGSRQGLKHIGAYLDRESVEKIALLRARLDMDNSELVRHAIERLYATESAKRKFGDA